MAFFSLYAPQTHIYLVSFLSDTIYSFWMAVMKMFLQKVISQIGEI